jgi:hypothetical protein
VAEAVGSATAAGLNTSVFAEAIAAAFATGGVPAQAMSAALTKAATTGGCNGSTRALSGEAHTVSDCDTCSTANLQWNKPRASASTALHMTEVGSHRYHTARAEMLQDHCNF